MSVEASKVLNLEGLSCPMPMVLLSQTLKELREGETVKVVADDPGFEGDLYNFCKDTGNEIISLKREGDKIVALLRKGRGSKDWSLTYWVRFHLLGVKLHLKKFLLELNPLSKKPKYFISFKSISDGLRAGERFKGEAVLLPVPDEIDKRCGVVLAFREEGEAKKIYERLKGEGFAVGNLYKREGSEYRKLN